MKPTAPLALAICLSLPLAALPQQPAAPGHPTATRFTDPANLAGERVSPRNGHELPIDGADNHPALGLAQLLRRLSTRASILNIVAHPDDEDGGMLTLYSRGLGARVADLSLTRGEGGQNFVTGDFEDALGLIRTQELLANDRYTGVSQLFGTEVDFGFSKTREEAFQKWTHDRVLYDAVRAIRIFRPLVITATFIGNVTDGHGQHQVSGEIAQEAFKAAADPNVFPDMIREGILPWQALKVYARVPFATIDSKGVYDYATNEFVPARFTNYVTGRVTTTKPPADVTVPEGSTDPLLTAAAANPSDLPSALAANPSEQLSYLQFARIGLSLQRTQISRNMTLPVSGMHNSGYTLYGSVLCNAPATARDPNITYTTSNPSSTHTSVILSEAKDPCSLPAAALPPTTSTSSSALKGRGFSPAVTSTKDNRALAPEGIYPPAQITTTPATYIIGAEAPAARPIPAQGNAVGYNQQETQRAEGPTHSPAPTTQPHLQTVSLNETKTPHYKPVILSEAARASASSAVEGPATTPAPPQSSEAFSPQDLTAQPNFFTGIDTSIESIATLAPNAPPFLHNQLAQLQTQIATATRDFNPATPSTIAPTLAAALQTTNDLINRTDHTTIDPLQKENVLHELRIKRVQLNDALALSLGLTFDGSAAKTDWVAGSSVTVPTTLRETSATPLPNIREFIISSEGSGLGDGYSSPGGPVLTDHTPYLRNLEIGAPNTDRLTQPYFHRDNIEQPVYQLRNPALRNAPQTPAPLTAWATVTYQGAEITLGRVVHNGPQPVSIIPPVSIASAPAATVLPTNQTTAQLTATLTTDTHTSANINVQSPQHWTIQAKAAGPNTVDFFLHPTTPPTDPAIFHLTATTPDHHAYTEGWRAVGYSGLILTNYYTPSITRVVPVDLKLPQHDRIAYLPGTGDAVPQALASIGLTPTMITVADLTPAHLADFDTVVLGVRAYTAHPDLQGAPTKALLNYASSGGNVVVQYQTSDFTSADAPYPLDLGPGEKVVVETDPVELLTPARTTAGVSPTTGITPGASPTSGVAAGFSPRSAGQGEDGALAPASTLLTTPNLISSADFNDWVSERGHGFLSTWDPHYTALTETHDPGGDGTDPQAPQRGGLITAPVGKGRWTYVAFALYRQLPQAVPGAFRLFVNLITPPAR